MAEVLKIVSVQRGHDPRDFVLAAFGGAGPLHAAALADEHAFRRHHAPAGVLARRQFVPSGGKIDRRVDAVRMAGVDLGAQQIEVEVRMLLADPGRPGTSGLPGFGGEERDCFAQGHRIDAILVGQRGVDATVLHIRAVAACVQFHGLLVFRMRS